MKKVYVSLILVLICVSSFLAYNYFRTYESRALWQIHVLDRKSNKETDRRPIWLVDGKKSPSHVGCRTVMERVIAQYKNDHPFSEVTEDELRYVLMRSEMKLIRDKQQFAFAIRSRDEELAAKLADIYGDVVEDYFCSQTNDVHLSKYLSQLESSVEHARVELERTGVALERFKTENMLDSIATDSSGSSLALAPKESSEIDLKKGEVNMNLKQLVRQQERAVNVYEYWCRDLEEYDLLWILKRVEEP